MDDTAESQLQGLNLQGVKQTNGVEYMNGDGVNSSQKMDDFEAQFQPVPAGKAASGLDPNAKPFEPSGEHSDLLGLETSDQTVPSDDFSLPANIATAPDPQPPSNDGVLIDFSGKDQASSPAPPSKGEGHIDPFLMDVGHADLPSTEGRQSLPQGMGVNVEGSMDNFDQDQGASEMECQCDNEPDKSLSQNVDDFAHSQNMNPSLSNVPRDMIESNLAQEEETVPMSQEDQSNQSAYQHVSSHERNSFDEQIVPGVCSCVEEPEPEVSEEEDVKEELHGAPQAQHRTEEGEVVGEDRDEYYDDGSDASYGDEEGGEQMEYQDGQGEEEEEGEIYTDEEDYTDDEDYDGPDSYRASEEREVASDYDGEARSSEERQIRDDAAQTMHTTQTQVMHVADTQEVSRTAETGSYDLSAENIEGSEMKPGDFTTEEKSDEKLHEENKVDGHEDQRFSEEREGGPLDEDERLNEERDVHVSEKDERERSELSDTFIGEVRPQENEPVKESGMNEGDVKEQDIQNDEMEDQYAYEEKESFEAEREVSEERDIQNVESVIPPPSADEHHDVVQDTALDKEETKTVERLSESEEDENEKYIENDEIAQEDVNEEVSVDDITVEDKPPEPSEESPSQVPDVILTTMQEPHREVPVENPDMLDVGENEEGEVEIQSNVSEFGSQYAEMGDDRMDEEVSNFSNGDNGEPKDEYYPDEREQEMERGEYDQQDVKDFVQQEEINISECVPEDVVAHMGNMESMAFDTNERQMKMHQENEEIDISQHEDKSRTEGSISLDKPPDSEELDQEEPEEHPLKADTFIESEGSDMEERSITPDPDQMIKMASPRTEVPQDVCDPMFHNKEPIVETEDEQLELKVDEPEISVPPPDAMTGSIVLDEGQTVEEHIPMESSKAMMEGSLILDEGQTIEDAKPVEEAEFEESPEDEIAPKMISSAMEGSLILDEGQTIEDAKPVEEAKFEESPEDEIAPKMISSAMEGSLILDEGQTIEDAKPVEEAKFEESPEDEIAPPMSGSAMEGSLIMDEGETIDDLPGEHTSVMEGSFVMDKGQTIEDLSAEQTGSVMEGSLIMDGGHTIEDVPQQQDVMSRSLMEDSIVAGEGETFDKQEIQAEHSGSTMEDTNTSEDSQASQKMNVMTGSMMEGSIVLDEDEKIEDRFPEDTMSKSTMEEHVMEESITHEEEQTSEPSPANVADESLSESYTESQTEESLRSSSIGYMDDEARLQRQTAQNMVENVLNDAIDTVESMQRTDNISTEESTDKQESGFEESVSGKSELPPENIEDVSTEEPSIEKTESAVEECIPDKGDISTEEPSTERTEESAVEEPSVEKSEEIPVAEPPPEKAEEKPKEVTVEKETAPEKEEKTELIVKTDEVKKKEKVLKEPKQVTKTEKDKKNVSVLSKEHKKEVKEKKEKPKPKAKAPAKVESKPTSAKTESEKAPVRDNKYSHITSRLTQDTSASLARKTVKRSELLKQTDSKLPSPEKGDVTRRSHSATRQARIPMKSKDVVTPEAKESSISRSKSTPRPGAYRRHSPSPMRGQATTTRNARPTRLLQPRKDAPAANGVTSPASGTEEEKAGKRTPSASSKKKYGIDSKNMAYKPGGGHVKIFDQKVQVKASPRVNAGAKTPPGSSTSPRKESPRPKPTTPKGPAPNVKNVTSKIGSLQNASYTPGGGQVKIASKKKDYSTVTSKVGSTANMDHKPGGGEKKILSQKLDWKTNSKIGSLDNAKHSPGGGNVKIVDEKVDWKTTSKIGSLDNASHVPGGGNVKIVNDSIAWNAQSKVGSLTNVDHIPGGGNVHIESHKVEFKAQSKVGSTDYMTHKPGGGQKKIETQKLDFKEKAKPKVESKTNHKPGGGDKKIETQKLNFKEGAKSLTDSGTGTPKVRTESANSQDSVN